jgi:hypothetical protein
MKKNILSIFLIINSLFINNEILYENLIINQDVNKTMDSPKEIIQKIFDEKIFDEKIINKQNFKKYAWENHRNIFINKHIVRLMTGFYLFYFFLLLYIFFLSCYNDTPSYLKSEGILKQIFFELFDKYIQKSKIYFIISLIIYIGLNISIKIYLIYKYKKYYRNIFFLISIFSIITIFFVSDFIY